LNYSLSRLCWRSILPLVLVGAVVKGPVPSDIRPGSPIVITFEFRICLLVRLVQFVIAGGRLRRPLDLRNALHDQVREIPVARLPGQAYVRPAALLCRQPENDVKVGPQLCIPDSRIPLYNAGL
jgi:hypothetical protein